MVDYILTPTPSHMHYIHTFYYSTAPSQLLPHIGFWMVDTLVNCTINAILMDFKFFNTRICIYLYSLPYVIYSCKQTFHILWLFIYLFILYHEYNARFNYHALSCRFNYKYLNTCKLHLSYTDTNLSGMCLNDCILMYL